MTEFNTQNASSGEDDPDKGVKPVPGQGGEAPDKGVKPVPGHISEPDKGVRPDPW